MKRIAINGFGRIGRLTARLILDMSDTQLVAINDLTDNKTLAHLFKYDSAHGIVDQTITATESKIRIGDKEIESLTERDPSKLPWERLGVDVVLECTGVFRTRESVQAHIDAGARKVVLSAPAKSDGFSTVVIGVNEEGIYEDQQCYSNASCTTNCLAPIIKVLVDHVGFVQGAVATIHAYTADQKLQDAPHTDLRRARAAAINIIPTTTGAGAAVQMVIPEIKGKLTACAYRVPVVSGSLVELNAIVEKNITVEELNAIFKEQSETKYKGVIQYMEDPIVSSDIIGNTYSSIFDSGLTTVNGKMIKVLSWYDNEAGYSARLAELASKV